MNDEHKGSVGAGEADWERLLRAAPPTRADRGFLLRVLTALPTPRRRRERVRAWVLLAAAVLAAVLLSALLVPLLAGASTRLETPVVACLAMVAVTFWTVSTVAE